jgi:hypothetical protein
MYAESAKTKAKRHEEINIGILREGKDIIIVDGEIGFLIDI